MTPPRWLVLLSLAVPPGCADVPPEGDAGRGLSPGALPEIADAVLDELPPCAGGVLSAFTDEAIAPPGPGSEGWMAPEADTLAAVRGSFQALHAGEAGLAVGMVLVVGYEVCRGLESERDLVLWRPAWPGTGRALFTLRARDARTLIVEAPHAFVAAFDGEAALEAFASLGARALIVAGSHPCANPSSAPCGDGPSLCGLEAPAISDPVHNDETVFHLAHTLLTEQYRDDWVVSLQAMDEPGVSVSAGALDAASEGSASATVGAGVMLGMPDANVTSCNEFAGANVEERACGTDSVQARHINGAEDICSGAPPRASGRYVQVSLSPAARERVPELVAALAWAMSVGER